LVEYTVKIRYNKHSGGENESPGKLVTKTGEVTKHIDSLGGGVYIYFMSY